MSGALSSTRATEAATPARKARAIPKLRLTLDIALRLEKLLEKEPGVEVVLTRRKDEYVALQERPAIANREGADLFLSIHANASRNRTARGVESYLLNFASTPDAAAVAARENASSTLTMSHLNDLVKQIALNSKLDESRDLARQVQTAMVRKLRPSNQQLKDLGVKQAPFVVLVGAAMPSVLVEVSFLSHKQEGRLLGTGAYRQRDRRSAARRSPPLPAHAETGHHRHGRQRPAGSRRSLCGTTIAAGPCSTSSPSRRSS